MSNRGVWKWRICLLVLHNAYPARLLAVAGTEPDIVRVRKPDLERAMRAEAGRAGELVVQPCAKLLETRLCAIVWYCPFGRVLRILQKDSAAGRERVSKKRI